MEGEIYMDLSEEIKLGAIETEDSFRIKAEEGFIDITTNVFKNDEVYNGIFGETPKFKRNMWIKRGSKTSFNFLKIFNIKN